MGGILKAEVDGSVDTPATRRPSAAALARQSASCWGREIVAWPRVSYTR